MMPIRTLTQGLALTLATTSLHAQWNPSSGDWLKSHDTDYRVMTWNVEDGLCSSNTKTDAFNNWNGIVRLIAAMQPDVVILQECGDNSGNGTGGGVDSQSTLETVCELLVHGGSDPFEGGTVGSYIQLFTGTTYDLPYIYVSESSDGFNRNVLLSRYPFEDINGGGNLYSTFVVQTDEYAPGGTGGIRGQQYAEIDLPDEIYAGDVVIANSHLKSGGDSSDFNDRDDAARNIAYFIDYYYNGAGTGTSDPNNKIPLPSSGSVLDDNTPVIWGGDFNQRPGGFGPVERMTRAGVGGGTDGTDRDRTDSSRDFATHPISGESSTQSSSKLDYICWQDSIATARRQFIFRSTGSGVSASTLPFPVSTYPVSPASLSGIASDHRPVIVDFILPIADNDPCPSPPDFIDDDTLDFFDLSAYLTLFNNQDPQADLTDDGSFDFFDLSMYLTLFGEGCP